MPDTTTPARRKPPAPRTGWWWLALALTGLMVLVLAVTVAVSVSNAMAAEARRANRSTPTTAKTAGQSAAPVQDWGGPGVPLLPLDEEKATEQVRAFLTGLGKAVRDPNGEPDELFTWTEMSEVVPDDAVEGQVGQLVDSISACRQVVQAEVNVWRQWDWVKVDVRKVMRRPDGAAIEAIVWHPTRDGKRVKRRWLLTDQGDGMVALGWEDLHTGVTARDRAYALAAASLSPSIRRQRQWQFSAVPDVHRLIDQRKWEEARARLDQLRTVRFDRELPYAVDLAEARLAFRDRTLDDGEWDQELAIEILDDLIARHPERLAAYPVLAEVSLESEEYARVIEVCDAFMEVAGDDPDALALRGAAKLALVQTDEAGADFVAALALDQHQPRAVNWQRQRADDERGKKAIAKTLATAPDPAALFDALVEWATPEADWPGVLALAERYRQLRPKDARWVSPLIDALLRLKRTDDALKVFKEALPVVSAVDLADVVRRFANSMIVAQHADKVYAAVPPTDAPAAFRPLAAHYEMMRERWITRPSDEGKEKRDAATKALTVLMAAHRKAHPDDPWLALHDGRLKNDTGKHEDAAAVIAPALAKLTPANDPVKDWQTGYSQLRHELIVARYKAGKGAVAYRELKHGSEVFNRLADMCLTDGDAKALTALLDERKAAGLEAADELFWRAEVDRLAGKYADAAAKYQQYIASDIDHQLYLSSARAYRLRCLVRAGESATALQDIRSAPIGAFSLDVRALVLAKEGRPADAELLLRSLLAERGWTGGLYADDDLGPILRKDPAFAAFRKDFPPPADKPAPPR